MVRKQDSSFWLVIGLNVGREEYSVLVGNIVNGVVGYDEIESVRRQPACMLEDS